MDLIWQKLWGCVLMMKAEHLLVQFAFEYQLLLNFRSLFLNSTRPVQALQYGMTTVCTFLLRCMLLFLFFCFQLTVGHLNPLKSWCTFTFKRSDSNKQIRFDWQKQYLPLLFAVIHFVVSQTTFICSSLGPKWGQCRINDRELLCDLSLIN